MPCFRRIGFDFEAREPAHMPAGITKRGGRDGARPSRVPILLARTVDLKKCRRCTGSVVTWCEAKDGTVAEAPCLPSESTPIGLPRSVHTGVSPTDRLGPNQAALHVAKRDPSVPARRHRADDTPLRTPVRDDLRRAHPCAEADHGKQSDVPYTHDATCLAARGRDSRPAVYASGDLPQKTHRLSAAGRLHRIAAHRA